MRGVYFKLEGYVHVIIPFNLKNYFDVVQALGRSTRSFYKSSECKLVQDKKVSDVGIVDYYKDGEANDARTEVIREKILRLNHSKEVTVNSSNDIRNCIKIFIERKPIYFQNKDKSGAKEAV